MSLEPPQSRQSVLDHYYFSTTACGRPLFVAFSCIHTTDSLLSIAISLATISLSLRCVWYFPTPHWFRPTDEKMHLHVTVSITICCRHLSSFPLSQGKMKLRVVDSLKSSHLVKENLSHRRCYFVLDHI